jgi:sulfur-carrier protein
MINIQYFASIREALGKNSESVALPDDATVSGLVARLHENGGVYIEALSPTRRWRVAVNQEMVSMREPLKDGDEVAIFPPVTGG